MSREPTEEASRGRAERSAPPTGGSRREGRGPAAGPRTLPGSPELPLEAVDRVLRAALSEDLGPGDVTTEVLVPRGRRARGTLVAKAEGVAAGLGVFGRVFALLDPSARVEPLARDGERFRPGDELVRVEGEARALLEGERTALNFVQRMAGIATTAARYVAAAGDRARICDTRKTTPGLRLLEKHAVRCGGATNHRLGLYDEVMVKNNHVDVAGAPMGALLSALRAAHGAGMRITAEARDEAEALGAAAGGADCVLLDNLSVERLGALCPRVRAAAASAGRTVELEASGGITLENVAAVAATGVDRISIGALTHSAPALDLSFRIEVLG